MASYCAGFGIALFMLFPRIFATCYFPNGTAVTSKEFQPCVATTGVVSMCCATNRTNFADECLSNGLCHNPCAITGLCGDSTGGQYWRETCTDKTWNSPFCLKNACTDPSTGGSASDNAAMSQCSVDGTWCCGGDLTSDACCAMKNRVVLAATVGVSSSTTSTMTTKTSSTASSSSTVTSTPASQTSIPASQSTSAIPPSSTSDTGLKIGLGVGISVGVLLIAAIVAFFVLRMRKLLASRMQRYPDGHGRSELDGNHAPTEMNGMVYNELPAKHVSHEVYG